MLWLGLSELIRQGLDVGGPGYESIGDEELSALTQAVTARQLSRYRFDAESSGSEASFTYRFERELEQQFGARHCLGMNSCTSALLCGLWALGIKPGDEVIVPGYTFVASMAAVAYAGGTIRLAEVDQQLSLDPVDVERKITHRTRAILCVHMLGMPCNMAYLTEVAKRHNLLLIEDCAQAGGGTYQGRTLGTFGDFGALSLNVFKTFTAGDGGVFLTNHDELFEKVFAIHDHGARPFRMGVSDAGGMLGLNFRMHELTGAVAWAQLPKLAGNLNRLRRLKRSFSDAVGPLEGAIEVVSHDAAGECGNVLAFRFENAARARRIANALGTKVLADSGKHNYANIPQLSLQSLPAAIPQPQIHPEAFMRGALPRTDDLLSRTIAFSVGVRDSYLGAGFGIHLNATPNEVEVAAEALRTAAGST